MNFSPESEARLSQASDDLRKIVAGLVDAQGSVLTVGRLWEFGLAVGARGVGEKLWFHAETVGRVLLDIVCGPGALWRIPGVVRDEERLGALSRAAEELFQTFPATLPWAPGVPAMSAEGGRLLLPVVDGVRRGQAAVAGIAAAHQGPFSIEEVAADVRAMFGFVPAPLMAELSERDLPPTQIGEHLPHLLALRYREPWYRDLVDPFYWPEVCTIPQVA